jgi:hypothetical protein
MAEIAQMRGLLDEMGRLSAGNCVGCGEAPTKLEGLGVRGLARQAYNTVRGLVPAKVVADKCAALLAVCGDRLEEGYNAGASSDPRISLTRKVQRLEKALRKAEEDEANAWNITWKTAGELKGIRLVDFVYQTMSRNLELFAERISGSNANIWQLAAKLKTMTGVELAVKLGEFIDAMLQYKEQHDADFSLSFHGEEKKLAEQGVQKLDQELVDELKIPASALNLPPLIEFEPKVRPSLGVEDVLIAYITELDKQKKAGEFKTDNLRFYALIQQCAQKLLTIRSTYVSGWDGSHWKNEWVPRSLSKDEWSQLIRGDILSWLTEAKELLPTSPYLTKLFGPLWSEVEKFCAT